MIYVFHIYVKNIVTYIFPPIRFWLQSSTIHGVDLTPKPFLGFRTTVLVMTPRWEYRVWGEDLSELRAEVVALDESLGLRVSQETYLVGSLDTNAKIRSGILEVKRLIEIEQAFQLWTPTLKEAFPLPEATVAEVLALVLGSDPPRSGVPSFETSGFLTHARGAGVIVADARKRRDGYRHKGCILEFAEVTINGSTLNTVAVESEELATATDLAARLGIDTLPNQSYPTAIRHTLHL